MAGQHDPSDGVAQLSALMRDAGPPVGAAPVDPAVRRRRRRRRTITGAVVVLLVVAAVGGYVGAALSAPLPPLTVTATTLRAPAAPEGATIMTPPEGAWAISVSGADDYLGADAAGIWAASGADESRPLASITKLVTAMVLLDAKPLAVSDAGPTLTFDKADHALYDKYYSLGATIAEMPTGSTMGLRDVLETMLIVSACNYAEAATTWAFGSTSAFVAKARSWLAANGLEHTTVVEPTGLDARNVSTPRDLLALGRLAMANPVIAEIVAMQQLDAPGIPSRSNTNTLLGVNGIRGIKTGTLDGAGSNLLFSAELAVGIDHPLEITGVLLGGTSHDAVDREVNAWLTSIAAGFREIVVGGAGTQLGNVTTPWGSEARLVLASEKPLMLWSDTPVTVQMTTPTVQTARKGEQVATVTWTAGPNATSLPVVLDTSIVEPDEWWRLTHPALLFGG